MKNNTEKRFKKSVKGLIIIKKNGKYAKSFLGISKNS